MARKRTLNGVRGAARGKARARAAILKRLEQHREAIRGFGVRRLGLFGSCARGAAGAHSDIDLLVELEDKTFDAYMGLKLYLEELFGCRVDLVLASAVKPALRQIILSEVAYAQGL